MTISTFSCDIAYSRSPAASRASASLVYMLSAVALPSRIVMRCANGTSMLIPLRPGAQPETKHCEDSPVRKLLDPLWLEVHLLVGLVDHPLPLKDTLKSDEDARVWRLNRIPPLHRGIEVLEDPVDSLAVVGAVCLARTISTFSCDIARAVSRGFAGTEWRVHTLVGRVRGRRLTRSVFGERRKEPPPTAEGGTTTAAATTRLDFTLRPDTPIGELHAPRRGSPLSG